MKEKPVEVSLVTVVRRGQFVCTRSVCARAQGTVANVDVINLWTISVLTQTRYVRFL